MGRSGTAPRKRLAARRRERGLTQASLAEAVGSDKLTVSSWERGMSSPRPSVRPALASALHLSLEELAVLLDDPGPDHQPAARGADGRPLPRSALAPESAVVAPWLDHYVLLEQIAARIEIVQLQLVPGLLQTRAYAEVIERQLPFPVTEHEVAQRVELRMDRQQVLHRRGSPGPLELAVVLPLEVLHNRIGDSQVMADQLRHLVTMAARSNVDIRLISQPGVIHYAISSFELVIRPETAAAPLVRTLDLAGARYHEDQAVTARFAAMFQHLQAVALSPAESVQLIEDAREHHR